MVAIRRIEAVWSGTTGLPGISVFHSLDSVSGQLAAIRAYFEAFKGYLPAGVTLSFPGAGDKLESTTGVLLGGWTDTQPSDVTATGTGYHAAGVGVIATWHTNQIVNGRRLRGRTFICPIASATFEFDGTVTAAARAAMVTAGNTLLAAVATTVWHRPTSVGAADGSLGVITATTVKDQVTRLRSRTV